MRSKSWAGMVAAGVAGALLASAGAAGSAPVSKPAGAGGATASPAITLDQANKRVKRTNLRLAADRTRLAYNKKRLVAKRGLVRITMTNPSNARHNIAIRFRNGREKKGRIVPRGGISRVQANLRKGRYRYFCSVPGHEAGGMWGTLIVR